MGGWELDLPTGSLYWSAETFRIHETTPEEYQPELATAIQFYAPESVPVIQAAVTRAMTEGQPYDLELRLVTARHRPIWVRATGRVERVGGKVVRVYGAFQDITTAIAAEETRRKLEGQLRQAQKLEAIGTLAGGIAHDFNNILGAVLGNTELALDTLPPDHDATPLLQQVLRSVDRAHQLVQQILTFSLQQDQERQPLQVASVVGEAVQLLRATLPASIRIVTDLPRDLPPVPAAAGQVRQVVINLCTNAAQAIGDRPGTLELSLAPVELDAESAAAFKMAHAGRFVRLLIRDDGIGMDRETLERIFEPFFTTRAPGGGSGLGLAVAHGIMRAHGGGISAFSEPGAGTSFALYFPVGEPAPGPAVVALEAPVISGHGERILMIDDEAALVLVGRRLLERIGYEAIAVTSPLDALARLAEDAGEVRAVITDYDMPGMSGLDVAREVQRLRPGLPVLLATGYTGRLGAATLGRDGIVGIIQKPYSSAALARALAGALGVSSE